MEVVVHCLWWLYTHTSIPHHTPTSTPPTHLLSPLSIYCSASRLLFLLPPLRLSFPFLPSSFSLSLSIVHPSRGGKRGVDRRGQGEQERQGERGDEIGRGEGRREGVRTGGEEMKGEERMCEGKGGRRRRGGEKGSVGREERGGGEEGRRGTGRRRGAEKRKEGRTGRE